jgi:glycosyltransferase involved in cell wall biosynthesis
MKVHYLLPLLTLKDNGGGAVALAFARRMVANGERVTILASDFSGTGAADLEKNIGIDFYIVPSFVKSQLAALIFFYLYGIAYSLRKRPRLIYTHIATGLIPNVDGGRPYMLAQDIEYRFYDGILRKIAKRVFAGVLARSSLLVTSERLATYFRRKRYQIIYEGDVGISKSILGMAERELTERSSRRDIDCLLIAKPGSHKRHAETVAVAEALADRGHTVTLIDQDRNGVSTSARVNLRVVGAVSATEMQRLYLDSKVFVSISRVEGYGLTPLEALAQGCQVVSTRTPSTMNLRHPSLESVTASARLVDDVVRAVERRIAAAALVSTLGIQSVAFTGPFMEDWAAGASAAIEGDGVR